MSDLLLRLAVRAYPRASRRRDGAVLLDCARELAAEGSSPAREALGLLRSGLACRAGLARRQLAAGPWRAALAMLALPLAAANLGVWSVGVHGLPEGPGDWAGPWSGDWLGWWWTIGLTGGVLALIGAALGRRRPSVAGAALSLVPLLHHAYQALMGLGGSRYSEAIGYFSIDVAAAWIPPVLLLVAAAAALSPAGSPVGSRIARRLAWGALPAAAAWLLPGAFVVAVALGMLAAALAGALIGTLRARSHPALALAGALVLAAILPEGVWLAAGLLPVPNDPLTALAELGVLYAGAAVVVIGLARRACAAPRAARPAPPPASSG